MEAIIMQEYSHFQLAARLYEGIVLCIVQMAYQCFGNIELANDPNNVSDPVLKARRAQRHVSCFGMGAIENSLVKR